MHLVSVKTAPTLVVPCALCAFQASGVLPLSVAHSASAHDRYAHGIGVSVAEHVAMRVQ